MHKPVRVLVAGAFIFVGLIGVIAVQFASGQRDFRDDRRPLPPPGPPERPDRLDRPHGNLVIIVPGTGGDRERWIEDLPGRATFASELHRSAGEGTEVYPFFWDGSDDHPSREAAARKLADLIDDRARRFDHVDLVGHSFGGNIALRASGLTHERVDMIICLSTPQVYVEARGEGDRTDYLPIFCDYRSRENTRTIINIAPSHEDLPSGWEDTFVFRDLYRRDVIPYADSWRDHMDYPHLREELPLHPIRSGEVFIARKLNVADANIKVQSLVTPWAEQHSAAHSRRMGEIVGELIRDGASPERLDYVRTLVQPADADHGEPIDEDLQRRWNEDHREEFRQFGLRLDTVTVDASPEDRRSRTPIHDLAVRLEIEQPDGSRKVEETPPIDGPDHAAWAPYWILRDRQRGEISVYNGRDRIGRESIRLDEPPPSSVRADPIYGIHLTADFHWVAVHH